MAVSSIGILYKASAEDGYDVLPHHIETIKKTLPGANVVRASEEAELVQSGLDPEVLLTWGLYRPAAFCQAAKNLQWIHALSAGFDGLVSVPEIRCRRLHVTATKGIHGLTIAEHTLGMILSFSRGFHLLRDQQHRKEWKKYLGCDEIQGKKVGVLGLGNIGRVVAQKCKAMGMCVLGFDLVPVNDPSVDRLYPAAELLSLLRDADYVVITLPHTPDTHHLISEKQLQAMKKSAYLFNVARGKIVDEPALTRALKAGVIAGAGLDVFENEPLPPTSELWEMPNVLVSPHMSAICPYYMDRAVNVFCDNLKRFVQGQPLQFELNWDTGF